MLSPADNSALHPMSGVTHDGEGAFITYNDHTYFVPWANASCLCNILFGGPSDAWDNEGLRRTVRGSLEINVNDQVLMRRLDPVLAMIVHEQRDAHRKTGLSFYVGWGDKLNFVAMVPVVMKDGVHVFYDATADDVFATADDVFATADDVLELLQCLK
jgi:hypothetical protein